jgi:hypothetical protein
MFNLVEIVIYEIYNIYHVLSRYLECKSQGKHDEVDATLFRAIVILPGTSRFLRWRPCLYQIFMYSEGDDEYELLFKIWIKIYMQALCWGEPIDEFHRFSMLAGYNAYA